MSWHYLCNIYIKCVKLLLLLRWNLILTFLRLCVKKLSRNRMMLVDKYFKQKWTNCGTAVYHKIVCILATNKIGTSQLMLINITVTALKSFDAILSRTFFLWNRIETVRCCNIFVLQWRTVSIRFVLLVECYGHNKIA